MKKLSYFNIDGESMRLDSELGEDCNGHAWLPVDQHLREKVLAQRQADKDSYIRTPKQVAKPVATVQPKQVTIKPVDTVQATVDRILSGGTPTSTMSRDEQKIVDRVLNSGDAAKAVHARTGPNNQALSPEEERVVQRVLAA